MSFLHAALRRLFLTVVSTALVGLFYVAWYAGIAVAEPDRFARVSALEFQGVATPSLPLLSAAAPEPLVLPDGPLAGREALLFNIRLLEEGCRRMRQVSDYTALFFKQEQAGGSLVEGQTIRLKLRHEPFSVYLCWQTGDKGREIIYVDGQNDGDFLYHPGGWKARLLPPLKLNPTGAIALRESRHPVTDLGLMKLAERIIERRRRDLQKAGGVEFRLVEDRPFDGRPCWCFELEYQSRDRSDFYRKSILWVDKQLALPVNVVTYGWPEPDETIPPEQLDEATLVEHYSYSQIRLNQRLAGLDFDRNNREYNFRR